MGATYDPTNPMQKAAVRKITLRLVPLLVLMYTFSFLDRINIGTAALTMNADLNITQTQFGLAGSLFLVGYFLMEIPSNVAFVRFGARIWFTRIMVTWGIVSSLTAFVQSPTQLIVVRVLLGIAEAGFFPGMVLYLALWFPREIRARVFLVTVLPFAVILGAPISTAIIQYADGWMGFAGWRIMFFVEGLPPILLGLFTIRFLTSTPAQATWLTREQREWLQSTAEVQDTVKHSVMESLRFIVQKKDLLMYTLAYGLLQMGFYAGLIFTPQIIASFGEIFGTDMSIAQVGLLTATPSLIAAVICFLWARHSDMKAERIWHSALGSLMAATGILVCLTSSSVYGLITGLTLLQSGLLCALPALWQLPTRGLSTTAAATVIAAVNCVGLAGSFISPIVIGWFKDTAGTYDIGLAFLAVMIATASVLTVAGGMLGRRAATTTLQ